MYESTQLNVHSTRDEQRMPEMHAREHMHLKILPTTSARPPIYLRLGLSLRW